MSQGQWGKLSTGVKPTAQSQWDKAEALRAKINKELLDAETSLQVRPSQICQVAHNFGLTLRLVYMSRSRQSSPTEGSGTQHKARLHRLG